MKHLILFRIGKVGIVFKECFYLLRISCFDRSEEFLTGTDDMRRRFRTMLSQKIGNILVTIL